MVLKKFDLPYVLHATRLLDFSTSIRLLELKTSKKIIRFP